MFRQKEDPDNFWQEYEEQIGEKVIGRSLGQYLYGWEEFDSQGWKSIWGLMIVSSGGFRFHHFPQQHWFNSVLNTSGKTPRDKTFFLPKEKIISAQLKAEKKWWKRIFTSSVPLLFIVYRDGAGNENRLVFESEIGSTEVINALCREFALNSTGEGCHCCAKE